MNLRYKKFVGDSGPMSPRSSMTAQIPGSSPNQPGAHRKETFFASLPNKAKPSLLVCLADKLDNAEAILNDYRVLDDDLWSRFTGKRYYRTISTIFAEALPGPLSTELSRIVSQFPAAESDGEK